MTKYRKKPLVVDAIQLEWDSSNIDEVRDFIGDACYLGLDAEAEWYLESKEEGITVLYEGNYVIKGIQGEIYTCKPDIFKQTYEEVM